MIAAINSVPLLPTTASSSLSATERIVQIEVTYDQIAAITPYFTFLPRTAKFTFSMCGKSQHQGEATETVSQRCGMDRTRKGDFSHEHSGE
jgi:hypothetical protein